MSGNSANKTIDQLHGFVFEADQVHYVHSTSQYSWFPSLNYFCWTPDTIVMKAVEWLYRYWPRNRTRQQTAAICYIQPSFRSRLTGCSCRISEIDWWVKQMSTQARIGTGWNSRTALIESRRYSAICSFRISRIWKNLWHCFQWLSSERGVT